MKDVTLTLVLGLVMGFALSRIGFSSWDEVHRMFTFADLRMFLGFCTAVVLLALSWRVLAKIVPSRTNFRIRPVHRGTLIGGMLFGVGWALTGACPSITLVQLGEGQLAAVWTLGGVFAGNWLYAFMHARYFRWDLKSCIDD